jgi:hypothetical protein
MGQAGCNFRSGIPRHRVGASRPPSACRHTFGNSPIRRKRSACQNREGRCSGSAPLAGCGRGPVFDGLRVIPSPLPTKRISPALVVQFRRAKNIAARMHHQSPFTRLTIANGVRVGPVPDRRLRTACDGHPWRANEIFVAAYRRRRPRRRRNARIRMSCSFWRESPLKARFTRGGARHDVRLVTAVIEFRTVEIIP